MIKAVLFDFGGVLTKGGRKGYIGQLFSELYNVPLDQIEYGDLGLLFRRSNPKDDDALFEKLSKRFNVQVTKEMFLERAHVDLVAVPETYKLAEELRSKGIRTGLLSNIFAMQAEVFRREGWYDGFDPIILSCESGYAKPERELYELAIEQLGLEPDEIIFIDDQQKCIGPAEEVGLHAILATDPEQVAADTKKLIREHNGVEL
jgi:epoxide hydrolase-like predicted phosphatase